MIQYCVDNAVISEIPNIQGVSSVENYPAAAVVRKFNDCTGLQPIQVRFVLYIDQNITLNSPVARRLEEGVGSFE